MNRLFLLAAGLCFALSGTAQNDSTRHTSDTAAHPIDTLHVGNLLIVRNGKPNWDNPEYVRIHRHRNWSDRPSKVSTDWVILDLGIAYFNDQTNYSSAAAQKFSPGSNQQLVQTERRKIRRCQLLALHAAIQPDQEHRQSEMGCGS